MGAGASRERINAYTRGRADRFAWMAERAGFVAADRARGDHAQNVSNYSLLADDPATALADVVDVELRWDVSRASNGGTFIAPRFRVHLPEQANSRVRWLDYAGSYSATLRQAGEAFELARMLRGRYPTPEAFDKALRALVARARADAAKEART